MQAIEDDLNKLQVNFQSGVQLSGQDTLIAQLSQRVQELGENPLWQEMQKTTVDIQQLKERFDPVMKDIEHRLKQLEKNIGDGVSQQTVQEMKENPGCMRQSLNISCTLIPGFHTFNQMDKILCG